MIICTHVLYFQLEFDGIENSRIHWIMYVNTISQIWNLVSNILRSPYGLAKYIPYSIPNFVLAKNVPYSIPNSYVRTYISWLFYRKSNQSAYVVFGSF